MNNFKEVVNIGNELSRRLQGIGIMDIDQLKQLGSKQTIIELAANNYDVCINSLYALEGAVKGIRWHLLTKQEKQSLKNFFDENIK